ncbi:MAG: hypothetical protein HY332_12885 [Chloroflexi bacterium]|nr:hypothetical protein [Chloroflexota bacterium]
MDRLDTVGREPDLADWRRRQSPDRRRPKHSTSLVPPPVRAAGATAENPDTPRTVDVRV